MADAPRRMNAREVLIGIVVLVVVFVVVLFGAGALNLGLPQWLLSAIAAVIGIFIWFALIGRLGGSKK